MVEVSVVVATHNRTAQVRRLLAQLDAQTLAPSAYEVIVVDDGSPQEVEPHLHPSAYRFVLQLERQPHAGASAARQRGAERASGDLLVFVDDDMHVPPGFLEAHLAAHDGEDRLVVLGRRRAGARASSPDTPLIERYRMRMGDRLFDEARAGRVRLSGEHLYTGNVSVARALFVRAGGFDPDLWLIDDAELGIRLEQAGGRFVLSDEAFNVHEADPMAPAAWFARSVEDGRHWARVARKHPDSPSASPWHFLEVVNPVSRPLLTLSALAPAPAALVARGAFRSATAADALGFEDIALAGATFVYGVHMFRGVGREAGSPRGALRAYREYRRGLAALRSGAAENASPWRELVGAIRTDYEALVTTSGRYDPRPRERELASPGAAFVTNIGFQVVVAYRLMRFMRALELALATRVVARSIRHLYGSDIHWDAELAPGLVVVHGFGLAISHAARTAPGCILAQNVTLGMGQHPVTGARGAPDLRENVVVGPGATLIGPIVIGAGAKVMPNCTVCVDVPPRTIVDAGAVSMRPR